MRKNITEIPYNTENINRYKSSDNLLRHARSGKDCQGIMLLDSITGSLIGYIGWQGNTIIAFEVTKEYRQQGYGNYLLGRALKSGCTSLTVDKKNLGAISLYARNGFIVARDNGKILWMTQKQFTLKLPRKQPLIFLSETPNLQNELILPKIPKDLISIKKGELQNSKLPRIRLFKNVGDAVSGTFLDKNIKGKKFYVYQGKYMRPDNTYEPDLSECPTLLKIPEVWYLEGLEVDLIGEIEILGPEKIETYHYGPRQTTGRFIRWKWKEILKPWEKKGKLR